MDNDGPVIVAHEDTAANIMEIPICSTADIMEHHRRNVDFLSESLLLLGKSARRR